MAQHSKSTGTGIMRAASQAPFLTREEEHELAVRWKEQRDESAMHRLASSHMRLVIAIATRFRHYGLQMPDLVQEGHVGLLEAAARFDPAREVRFSTYATWWIRAAIQDHILRNWSIVRGGTSSGQKALFFNLRRLRARMMRVPGSHTSAQMHEEIAMAIGVPQRDVALMDARLSGPDLSLNAPVSDDDPNSSSERGDFLVDEAPLPEEAVGMSIDSERRSTWLHAALNVLNERELKILRERRLKDEAVTLEALGSRMGISKERVRQIENRALEKVRRALVERHPEAYLSFS
ncbi:RNA polymerase factor sigma-32 [Agaricicola taiwanensis]|uniref:RNA polymerase factor sigma-32 n=1 Tax=Agaricicola taiwanensis TaxID=591372 RepID=A0A8J3DZT4_9RHOB|nr:RNA polymerase factor sigma-32 [Agaricicola taiwanensis]GGE51860.1 RNA polymerase factor sigma-32 [Agaricicola taiwanensis]